MRKCLNKFNINIITLIEDADNENCNCGTKLGEKYESTLRHPTKLLNI